MSAEHENWGIVSNNASPSHYFSPPSGVMLPVTVVMAAEQPWQDNQPTAATSRNTRRSVPSLPTPNSGVGTICYLINIK